MDYFGIDPANFAAPETLEGGGGHKHGHRAKHHRAEPLSFNASIMKLWRHHHAGASMGAKAMSAINGIVTDVGKQIASVAAEAAAKSKHMTISERDIKLATHTVLGAGFRHGGLGGGEIVAEAAVVAEPAVEALAGGKKGSPKKHRKSPKHKSPARSGAPAHFSVSRAERLIRMEAKGDQRVSRMACMALAHVLEEMTTKLLSGAHAHMHAEKRKRLSTADLRHAAEHDASLHILRAVHFASGGSVHSHESLRDMEEMHERKAKRSRK
jgi:histone H3/H4